MVRRADGIGFVVLFNSRKQINGQNPAVALDPLLHRAIDAVAHWPDHDLFFGPPVRGNSPR